MNLYMIKVVYDKRWYKLKYLGKYGKLRVTELLWLLYEYEFI